MKDKQTVNIYQNVLLLQVVCIICIIAIEIVFRLIGYDFEEKKKAFDQIPIYYRYPTFSDDDIFFRRPGPQIWKGKVLAQVLKQVSSNDPAYKDEQVVTITYDNDGFRNPLNLKDWDIVFVGDSFTELGYLPYEDLFTTQVGNMLHVPVKNLGVSYTGPLTYCYYLKKYGKSASTKHAVMVFYEGNDFLDLIDEESRLLKRAYGVPIEQRRIENLPKQTSFIIAVYRLLTKPRTSKTNLCDAYFVSKKGLIPVSVKTLPPCSLDISSGALSLLKSALSLWAENVHHMGIKPWLAFMPSNTRVLYDHLSFTKNPNPQIIKWKPTDLPNVVEGMCKELGIGFIDLTPDLCKQSQNGVLTYNTLYDNHLNLEGSRTVAKTLATALSTEYKNTIPRLDRQ